MATPNARYTAVTPNKPNEEQAQRAAALRKFNWLFIYTPILLSVAIILTLLGMLTWRTFTPEETTSRAFASGLADMVTIFILLPMLLTCALPIVGAGAWFVYRRQNQTEPKAPYGRLRPVLWKVDSYLSQAQTKTEEYAPKAAQPVIKANARLAFITTFIKQLISLFKRSSTNGK